MGKAKQFKKMRRIASQLPVIETASSFREQISGKEVIAQGVTTIKGEPVLPGVTYTKAKPKAMNHFRNMKREYNKGGIDGAVGYMNAVVDYDRRRKATKASK